MIELQLALSIVYNHFIRPHASLKSCTGREQSNECTPMMSKGLDTEHLGPWKSFFRSSMECFILSKMISVNYPKLLTVLFCSPQLADREPKEDLK